MSSSITNMAQNLFAITSYSLVAALVAVCASPQSANADGLLSDYQATPPLLTASGDKANVLVVLDNSNSMDENAFGQAVGSANASSKSEIARSAVKSLVTNFNGKIRMGLMAYQQNSMSKYQLHNAFYDISFDPSNFDSTFTGARDSLTKRFREPKPSSTEYVYYNVALPFYAGSSQGTRFCYSNTADFDNGTETYPGGPWDTYRCYDSKSGGADNLPSSSGSGASTYGWGTHKGSYTFSPTDSDLAQGILDFGRFMAWKPVGDTWYVNTSPGKGYLHVKIADLDATQTALLNAKLGTSQFASNKPTDPAYPLQNAGLTPLAGTLDTAKRYFANSTLASSEGGPAPAVPTNSCGKKDFVVLVTDGLPSVDSSGSQYTASGTKTATEVAIDDVKAKAAALVADGVKVYVVGFALPATVDPTLLDQIAASGGTTTAYLANDTATLNSALGKIFQDIMTRTSSASNAAVVSNNNAGEGALYQATYSPELTRSNAITGVSSTVSWSGQLRAIFVDTYGNLREDSNGNKQLDNYSADKIISLQYDAAAGRTKLYRYNSTDSTIPTGLTLASTAEIDSLIPVWDARDGLANIDNSSIGTQRVYSTAVASTGASRYLFTWIDDNASGTAGVVDASEVRDFVTTNVTGTTYQYFAAASVSAAQDIVDFVRGKEGISGFRSRSIDYDADGVNEVLRLGDIVHSTPAVVGIPNDGYDLLYGDYTYTAFRNHYKDRRQVAYVGANDGVLHAFNGGFWDNTNKKFVTTLSTETAHPLGAELWGYVPQALLPHLKWLTDVDYPHVYYVDGPPLVFDANIFTPDADHPNGWGTVLVVGLRFGGGPFTVDSDGDGLVTPGTDTTLRSSYIVMDVTNPEVAPTLIAEISDSALGFTTGTPTVVKARAASSSGSWTSPSVNQWYLVFGSGPTAINTGTSSQIGKVYAYKLNAGSRGVVNTFNLTASNSFVGDLSSSDWNTDFLDDAVYFGTVSGTTSAPSGNLQRIHLDTVTAAAGGSPWTAAGRTTLINSNQPFISAPIFANDPSGRNWVFAGSGRLFATGDNSSETQQSFYGVMEPVDATGTRTWGTVSDLRDSTNIDVYTDSSISPATLTDKTGAAITTFSELQADIATRDGWRIDFSAPGSGTPSERSLSAATRISSLLLFTSYSPSADPCSPEGDSTLWVANYRTGTADPSNPFSPATPPSTPIIAPISTSLGGGLASTPLIHRGAGATGSGSGGGTSITVFDPTSRTNIHETSITLEGASGGRQSWRELEIQ